MHSDGVFSPFGHPITILFWFVFGGDVLRLLDVFGASAVAAGFEVAVTASAMGPAEAGVELMILSLTDKVHVAVVITEVCGDISLSQTCVEQSFIEDDFKTVAYDGKFGFGTLYILTSFLASW